MSKANEKNSEPARKISRFIGNAWGIGVLSLIALMVFILVGFVRFAMAVSDYETAKDARADAIVVLTGGGLRIEAGLRLLQNGQGKRLLISGVNPNTSARAIEARFPNYQALFACCIDLDRLAMDTAQNATETAKWVGQHGYQSLIVVTSDYHMPRSLMEMSAAMPEILLVPHAVRLAHEAGQSGIDISSQVKMMVREFFKTIASSFKL